MTITPEQIASKRVAKGASKLDRMAPGWHRLIDLDTLDLANCSACVCGQVARNLRNDLNTKTSNYLSEFRENDGFDACSNDGVTFGMLDAEWRRIIVGRLESEAAA